MHAIRPLRGNKPPGLVPRAFRKRLSEQMRRDISLIHHSNLDALIEGAHSAETLLHLAGAVLTWYHVAERLKVGEPEMNRQVELVQNLINRFNTTGSVSFDDDELQLARDGVVVMDLVASEADLVTAAWAAEKSEAVLRRQLTTKQPDA